MRSCCIHLRVISGIRNAHNIHLWVNMSLKITNLRSQPYTTGANELNLIHISKGPISQDTHLRDEGFSEVGQDSSNLDELSWGLVILVGSCAPGRKVWDDKRKSLSAALAAARRSSGSAWATNASWKWSMCLGQVTKVRLSCLPGFAIRCYHYMSFMHSEMADVIESLYHGQKILSILYHY